jgi:hypothetical protein
MFVHPKKNLESIKDLQVIEKKDQSETESIKQILEVSKIIKKVVRQRKITDYDDMIPVFEKTIMGSEKHQRLVNALALKLEEEHEIKITGIDVEGSTIFLNPKFRNLPMPDDHQGMPDLQGNDSKETIHLGIVIIDEKDPNVAEQLESFSSRSMNGTKIPVPLHVMVPNELRDDMESKIRQIGLGDKLDFGIITVYNR